MRCFVSGIGTDVGKTVVSAWLCRQYGARYWKPVQAGLPRDSDTVAQLAGLPPDRIYPETYLLNTPASPHKAAAMDGLSINLQKITLPDYEGPLVVEGAGGLLVPLNEKETVADLALHLGLPLVLVSRYYLGSINHTLLSLEFIKAKGISLMGVVLNGRQDPYTDEAIFSRFPEVRIMGRVPEVIGEKFGIDDILI